MPLPIRSLHHIAVATRNADSCKAFYIEVLGFRELPRPPFNFRGAWLYNFGFQIHVIEHAEFAPDQGAEISSYSDHLAFAVTNIEEAKSILGERGIPFRERVNAGGTQQVFFHDPDGHTIELAVYGDPVKGYEAPVKN